MRTYLRIRGFTLVEVLIVVAIVALLAGIVIANIQSSLDTSRDGKRVADIKQLELAFELYKETNGSYPSGYDSGVVIGVGNAIDTDLAPYFNEVPSDPRSDVDGFDYYYDSSVTCGSSSAVIYAQTLETNSEKNYTSVCTGSPSGFAEEPTDGYIIAL